MATIVPQLTAVSTEPGNGVCLFFYKAKNIFYPGGIGSSLGYTNYNGPVAHNSLTTSLRTEATSGNAVINGIRGGYVGVGFDIKGDFSNTNDGKVGSVIHGTATGVVSTCPVSVKTPNTICVRLGEGDYYKVHTTTENLSTYPISSNSRYDQSPPVTLHQYVSSVNDVVFTTIKVTILNDGRVLRVDMKNPADDIFYPYLITQINSTGLQPGDPIYEDAGLLGAGLSFTTSSSVMNCDVKNFSIHSNQYDLRRATDTVVPRVEPVFATNYTHPDC